MTERAACAPQPSPRSSLLCRLRPGEAPWPRDPVPSCGTSLACRRPPRTQPPFVGASPGPVLGAHRPPLTSQSCSPATGRKLAQGQELARGRAGLGTHCCRTPGPGPPHGAVPPPGLPQPSLSPWARAGSRASPRPAPVCGHRPCCCPRAWPGPHSCLPLTSGGRPSLGTEHGSPPHTPAFRPAAQAGLLGSIVPRGSVQCK